MGLFKRTLVRTSEYNRLREEVTRYQRELEDIGWINLSMDPGSQGDVIIGNFKKMIRSCRVLYFNNPLAAHWVNLTTMFTFGEGLPKPKAKDPKIQEVIDVFWDDIDNRKALTSFAAQQFLSSKLQVEGNLFFVFFEDEEGNVRLRLYNTEEVDDVITDEEDRLRENFFKVGVFDRQYDFNNGVWKMEPKKYLYYPDIEVLESTIKDYKIPEGKLVDAARMYHVKINCDINDKFGVPELYRGMDWIKAHKSAMEDMATLVKALSQFAWKKKIKGGAALVQSIAANMKSTMNLRNLQNSAGQMQIENEGTDLQSIDVKTGGVNVARDGGRELKLMICAASGIFEHYFGDPSTGNLATAKSMELPMVKKFTNYQALWKDIILRILDYVIDRKVEIGLIPGTVTDDLKTKRRIVKTTIDRTIDFDFPPILEEDLKAYAEGMKTAKEAGLIADKSAARMFMMAANMDDIDHELEELEKDVQRKAEEAAAMQDPANPKKPNPMNPSATAKPGATNQPGLEVTKEAGVVANTKTKLTMRHEKKVNYVMQKMNSYRKSLKGHFKDLLENAKNAGKVYQVSEGRWTFHVPGYGEMVHKFAENMQSSARQHFPVAIQIGEKYMQSSLKDLKESFKLEETTYEKKMGNKQLLQRRLDWNQNYLHDKFSPALTEAMDKAARSTYASEDDARIALSESVTKFDSRVEQYVGAFWTVEEDAVREAGQGTGAMVEFGGPDDDHTCEGCEEAVKNSPYPIDEAPLPGEQECLGRCRHFLQVTDIKETA